MKFAFAAGHRHDTRLKYYDHIEEIPLLHRSAAEGARATSEIHYGVPVILVNETSAAIAWTPEKYRSGIGVGKY